MEVELDPLDKNREGALKVQKAPFWRYGFLLTVAVLWLACLPLIVSRMESALFATLTAVAILAAIALVVWYLLANRVSGFHSAGLSQIAQSEATKYQYRVHDDVIQRRSDEGCKTWRLEQFVGSEVDASCAIMIFRTAVCYLPFRGGSRQQIVDFVQEVERLARTR